jgi:hypothetical protein
MWLKAGGSTLLPLFEEVGRRVIVHQSLDTWLVAVRETPSRYRVVGALESELLAESLRDSLLGTTAGQLR